MRLSNETKRRHFFVTFCGFCGSKTGQVTDNVRGKIMSSDAYRKWANRFRCEAVIDGAALLRRHLQRIGLPDEPEKLVEGTILCVNVAGAYSRNDCRAMKEFLSQQSYCPTLDPNTHYSFTFNLREQTYARIITPLKDKTLDLADLYGHPWKKFQMCGYSEIRIARVDDRSLSEAEYDQIEKTITDDIFFDFTEDEVYIAFDRTAVPGILVAYFLDVETDMEEN